MLVQLGVYLMYFGIAGFSYQFLCAWQHEFMLTRADDKRLMKHPRFVKNQVKQEIAMSMRGFRASMRCLASHARSLAEHDDAPVVLRGSQRLQCDV